MSKRVDSISPVSLSGPFPITIPVAKIIANADIMFHLPERPFERTLNDYWRMVCTQSADISVRWR
jgi:hypothetical protein